MALYNAFPPHRIHSSRPVAPSEALNLLSNYLELAAEEPYLQPNAFLTEGGPVAASSGPNTALILHNLKRMEAGLRGEHLSADLDFLKGAEDDREKRVGSEAAAVTVMGASKSGVDGLRNMEIEEDGWQDKAEFEREQDTAVGEVDERAEAIVVDAEEDVNVPAVKTSKSTADKDARKQKKKEKRMKEKRETEERRKAKKSDSD